LLLLDPSAVPFERIWCDFELFTTVSDSNKMLDIVTMRGKPRLLTERILPGEPPVLKNRRELKFPIGLLSKGLQVMLQDGNASVQQDKVNILQSMGRNPLTGIFDNSSLEKNIELANTSLRSYFAVAAWPVALKQGVVRSLGLPDVLKHNMSRNALELNFGTLDVSDKDMEDIKDGLPDRLHSLNLIFDNCRHVSDMGMAVLAKRIGELPLQSLHLDFLGCPLLTDRGVSLLACSLPPQLQELHLEFGLCHGIGIEGVKSLGLSIPAGVQKFKACFKGTQCDKTFTSVDKLKKMHHTSHFS